MATEFLGRQILQESHFCLGDDDTGRVIYSQADTEMLRNIDASDPPSKRFPRFLHICLFCYTTVWARKREILQKQ